MTKHLTDLKCESTIYITPEKIMGPVRNYFGGRIPLDPATEPSNPTGAEYFCTEGGAEVFEGGPPKNWSENGLTLDWSEFDGVFLNPPYGKEIRAFCEKIHEEATAGATIIALLPAGPRFSTKYFQEFILTQALDGVCFVRGRVKFIRPDGSVAKANPYDSMIMGFNVNAEHFGRCFSHLGKTFCMEVVV